MKLKFLVVFIFILIVIFTTIWQFSETKILFNVIYLELKYPWIDIIAAKIDANFIVYLIAPNSDYLLRFGMNKEYITDFDLNFSYLNRKFLRKYFDGAIIYFIQKDSASNKYILVMTRLYPAELLKNKSLLVPGVYLKYLDWNTTPVWGIIKDDKIWWEGNWFNWLHKLIGGIK